jgi:hypothetical protein
MSRRSVLRAVRGPAVVAFAAIAAGAIAVAGTLVPTQRPDPAAAAVPIQGRTSSVCTTGTLGTGKGSDASESQVFGASATAEVGATGTLTGRSLGAGDTGSPLLSIDRQGQSKTIDSPDSSVVLVADGVMAGASAGMVYGQTDTGEDRGLSLGPCTSPVVEQWFTGLGATAALRSQLVLTNPDDRQAEVDLEFFGPHGLLTVPGASGLIIPAGTSRTLSLEDLLGNVGGSISVRVKASVGRVSAISRDLRADSHGDPTGVDWHPASAMPADTQIIPAVPGGDGYRKLVIFNPGQRRADVTVEVLGPDGPFAPANAASVSIGPGASTTVDVASGLAKTIGTLRVTSSQPIVSAVQSERSASKEASDIAVNTAQPPVSGMGIAPATAIDGTETEFAISNGGTTASNADVTLYNADGVALYHERVPVPAGASIERRVTQAGPAFLVLRAPAGSSLYGGVTLTQSSGSVAGLAAASFVTPGLAGRARVPVENPRVTQ